MYIIYTSRRSVHLSPDNARSVAFSQRANSLRLIEDEFFQDSDIINNLVDYEVQQEPDSLRVDKIYAGIQVSRKLEKHFLKIDTNSERSMKFQKELRSRISGYRDIYNQLTNRPSRKNIALTLWCLKINQLKWYLQVTKAILNLIHHRKMSALGYDE
ncbi:uncharacterized protein TNCV_966911 [Trichonephila clavipes]|nr:uncharacterized protein TNCV_966911 [Trichonephila clavipes]